MCVCVCVGGGGHHTGSISSCVIGIPSPSLPHIRVGRIRALVDSPSKPAGAAHAPLFCQRPHTEGMAVALDDAIHEIKEDVKTGWELEPKHHAPNISAPDYFVRLFVLCSVQPVRPQQGW